MYRLTTYDNSGNKDSDEFKDEDALRNEIDRAIDQIESHQLKTFSVSWIKDSSAEKSEWWDKD